MRLAYNTLEYGGTPDLRRMLAELKDAGWEGWEVRQSLDWLGSADRVSGISEAAGPRVAGLCGQGWDLATNPVTFEINCRRIEFASRIGAEAFVIMSPSRPPDRSPTAGEIASFAASAEDLAQFGAEEGMTVAFHFHTGQMVQSQAEVCQVMNATRELRLCVDVSHAQLVDWDACECLREWSDRRAYVHLQDYRGWRYVNIGSGGIFPSIPAIFDTLGDIGFDGWVVCHGGHCTDQPPHERG